VSRPWVFVVAAGLALTACGGDDDGGVVGAGDDAATSPAADPLAEAPTFEGCAAEMVAAFTGFDVTGIDVSDGFDDAEIALVDERFAAAEAAHPAIGEEHPCSATFDAATEEQMAGLIAQLDPAVVEVIATPRELTPLQGTQDSISAD
jgi:hypothetical protein